MKNKAANIHKRFGDPPRIQIVPVVLGRAEARNQSDRIFEAYSMVLSSILNRPAAHSELFGIKSLERELEGV